MGLILSWCCPPEKQEEGHKKKKADKKFKKAGQGYALTGESSSSSSNAVRPSNAYKPPPATQDRRQVADTVAEAAARRLQQPEPGMTAAQRRIIEEARRQLEEEKRAEAQNQGGGNALVDERDGIHDLEHTNQISTLLFTCDLLENYEPMPKKEVFQAVEQYLRSMLEQEPADASVIMIWALNGQEKIDQGIEILVKYLNNIIDSPNEPKFRRIRTSNKIFKEKVASLKGGVEFLKAVGFLEDDQQNQDGTIDTFLALPEPDENTIDLLRSAVASLENGARISLKLYRDPKFYRINTSKPIPAPEIPPDFYVLSPEEIKREQRARAEAVDKLTTLRTSKMREADEKLRQYNYRYTLVRVRFPNDYILQGVFSVYERFGTLREFVSEKLADMLGAFSFTDPASGRRFDDDEKSFKDYGLAPAALLYFEWDIDTLNSISHAGLVPTYLHSTHERIAEPL